MIGVRPPDAGALGQGWRGLIGFPGQDFLHELVEDQRAFAAALDGDRRLKIPRLINGCACPDPDFSS